MGKPVESINDELAAFIRRQRLFFVATAPLAGEGHINLSPKGLDTFAILGPKQVAYLDLTGSGAETIAHLRENGRIVVMFCALEGPAKILRLHGRGRVVLPDSPEFAPLAATFPPREGARALIVVDVERVATSCGWGVPRFEFSGERDELDLWSQKKGPEGLATYREKNNRASIDGLPGL
ncbi:MAG: pyridoxamine 5'-phosphate oxidase family protein [Planctomycetota bacterium]|nr:pyridoxamine 5'-phosphate oxidase family protein [Planctomycetota bacterium]